MAYTTAQLVTAFTNANLGKAPDSATTLTLDAYATQSQTGGVTDAVAFANTLKLVNNTTAVAVETYQFFTGHAPSAAGLDYLVDSTTNTNDLNDAYYAKFAQENRFINFSINLAT
ncbi:MAG: S-layer protein, partial [bacterium]|nr:S-layer protein [bacterium]